MVFMRIAPGEWVRIECPRIRQGIEEAKTTALNISKKPCDSNKDRIHKSSRYVPDRDLNPCDNVGCGVGEGQPSPIEEDGERYSYRSDSTGSTLAAFRAGKKPAMSPIAASTPVVINIVVSERTGLPRNCIALIPSLAGIILTAETTP
jgi:hypothetical protein